MKRISYSWQQFASALQIRPWCAVSPSADADIVLKVSLKKGVAGCRAAEVESAAIDGEKLDDRLHGLRVHVLVAGAENIPHPAPDDEVTVYGIELALHRQ